MTGVASTWIGRTTKKPELYRTIHFTHRPVSIAKDRVGVSPVTVDLVSCDSGLISPHRWTSWSGIYSQSLEIVEKMYFDHLPGFVYVELMRGLQEGFVPKRCSN